MTLMSFCSCALRFHVCCGLEHQFALQSCYLTSKLCVITKLAVKV